MYTQTLLGFYRHVKYCTKSACTHLLILPERNKHCAELEVDNVEPVDVAVIHTHRGESGSQCTGMDGSFYVLVQTQPDF